MKRIFILTQFILFYSGCIDIYSQSPDVEIIILHEEFEEKIKQNNLNKFSIDFCIVNLSKKELAFFVDPSYSFSRIDTFISMKLYKYNNLSGLFELVHINDDIRHPFINIDNSINVGHGQKLNCNIKPFLGLDDALSLEFGQYIILFEFNFYKLKRNQVNGINNIKSIAVEFYIER
jgi:hypothetical protein